MESQKINLQAVTFNIRYDCGLDGDNCFCFRKSAILQKIQEQRPEIIGFQEVLPHVMDWLQENLTDYLVVGCGRGACYEDEHMAIACRKDCIELFGLDTFWLSPTPNIPGSRYEPQGGNPRICTCVQVKHKEHPVPFRVYVTHLDNEEQSARSKGLEQILARIEEDREKLSLPVILMGDFNAQPGSPELERMERCSLLRDVTTQFSYTYHEFGKESAYEKIDYIFLSPEIDCSQVCLWTECRNGVYLSDHYPVSAQLSFS